MPRKWVIGAVVIVTATTLGTILIVSKGSSAAAGSVPQGPAVANTFMAAGGRADAGQNEWMLGQGSLAVTRNGGATWSKLPGPPLAPGAELADVSVLTNETVGVTLVPGQQTVALATLRSGASTWQSRTLPVSVPVVTAQIVDRGGELVGIAVNSGSGGAAESPGEWLSTTDSGTSWDGHPTPSNGTASAVGGDLWLVGEGGAAGDLYESTDDGLAWQAVNLPITVTNAGQPAALSTVEADGSDLVVTATGETTTQVIVGVPTSSGWSWTAGPELDLGGQYGTGTPARAISVADGVLWVLSPTNQLARVTLTGTVTTVAASGMPATGTINLYATGANTAVAQYATVACAIPPKIDCVQTDGMLATKDGGQTWTPLALQPSG